MDEQSTRQLAAEEVAQLRARHAALMEEPAVEEGALKEDAETSAETTDARDAHRTAQISDLELGALLSRRELGASESARDGASRAPLSTEQLSSTEIGALLEAQGESGEVAASPHRTGASVESPAPSSPAPSRSRPSTLTELELGGEVRRHLTQKLTTNLPTVPMDAQVLNDLEQDRKRAIAAGRDPARWLEDAAPGPHPEGEGRSLDDMIGLGTRPGPVKPTPRATGTPGRTLFEVVEPCSPGEVSAHAHARRSGTSRTEHLAIAPPNTRQGRQTPHHAGMSPNGQRVMLALAALLLAVLTLNILLMLSKA